MWYLSDIFGCAAHTFKRPFTGFEIPARKIMRRCDRRAWFDGERHYA
jgi:hypothetical protein